MPTGAIIAGKQNRYIRAFRAAGAVSEERALTLAEAGCADSLIFRRMIGRGVFVETETEHYYLDLDAADAFLAARRRNVIVAVAVAVVVIGAVFLLNR